MKMYFLLAKYHCFFKLLLHYFVALLINTSHGHKHRQHDFKVSAFFEASPKSTEWLEHAKALHI